MQSTLVKAVLTQTFILIAFGLSGQNQLADKKISEIEAYKKYQLMEVRGKDKLTLKDSLVEVTAIGTYRRKKDGLGKSTEESVFKGGQRNRVYYFNEGDKLFAIKDLLKYDNGGTKSFIYYFAAGKLSQVFDENKNNVTDSIAEQRLYFWIRYMFDNQIIVR
jgi:hypothetical protein